MHRVTSRQRLFSWDHFDASPPSTEEDDKKERSKPQQLQTLQQNIRQANNPNFIVDSSYRAKHDYGFHTYDDDDDDDDQSDYKTCCMSMSRHGSMLFNQQSFGCTSKDDGDNSYNDKDGGEEEEVKVKTPETSQVKTGNNFVNIISDVEDDNEDEDDDDDVDERYSSFGGYMTNREIINKTSSSSTTIASSLFLTPSLSPAFHNYEKKPIQDKEKQHQHLTLIAHVNRDVQYHILSFLDLHSLRSTSLSCRYLYELLTEQNEFNLNSNCAKQSGTESIESSVADASASASGGCARNAIWWDVMKRQWPFLPLGNNCDSNISSSLETVRRRENEQVLPFSPYMVHFTTTCTLSATENSSNDVCGTDTNINYGKILTQSYTKHPPTKIHSSFFDLLPSSPSTMAAAAVTAPIPFLLQNQAPDIVVLRHQRRGNDGGDDDQFEGGRRMHGRNRTSKLFTSYTMNVNRRELKSFSSNYIPSYEKKNDDKEENNLTTVSSMGCSLSSLSSLVSCETSTDSESYCKFEVVQYIGRVGVGDRSIRSNEPFPRPLESLPVFKPEPGTTTANATMLSLSSTSSSHRSSSENSSDYFMSRMVGRKRSLPQEESISPLTMTATPSLSSLPGLASPMNFFDRLRSCNRKSGTVDAVVHANQHPTNNGSANTSLGTINALFVNNRAKSFLQRNGRGKFPFVSPMVTKCTYLYDDQCPKLKRYMEIDITPRMMAYFEVSILPRHEEQEKVVPTVEAGRIDDPEINGGGVNEVEENIDTNTSSACVAIGLSMEEYLASVRMPGWDEYSYGYHGDDGGIFHSRGDMIRVYGPKYNVGDTVGCGVNYLNGGIFFTLNGDFLGYAWCNEKTVLDGRVDLYPTVGVDSPNPLACNFGNERPFVWDFPKFVARN